MKNLAPVVLFVYARPMETKELIESLKNNKLANESLLFIFSDAPKSQDHLQQVLETREIIRHTSGFKKVTIFESAENKGLARSIIEGVSKIINEYGKVIVLEDDFILARDFLDYMNEALEIYKNNHFVWSVTGYSPPIDIPNEYLDEVYLSYRGSSWGWGTWKDRWNKNKWDLSDYKTFIKDSTAKKNFTKGGGDLLKMLELQALGKLDSWAIRSFYSQFKHSMYTVYPVRSKVQNMGFGKNATHCTSPGGKYKVTLSDKKINFNHDLKLNENLLYKFKKFHDLDIIAKIGYFLKRHNLYNYFEWTKKYLRK